MQPEVNMFWQGPMSSLESACISSFLSKGINVKVYSYQQLELPMGAALHDAAQILPEDQLFYFEGSPSAFTNIFRYKLLLERGGWWVDADVVMLADRLPAGSYYWAWEDSERINGAILRFPPKDSRCRQLLSLSLDAAKKLDRWGALGPELLTKVLAPYCVHNEGTTEKTYPIHWLESHYLWFPEFAQIVAERSRNASFLHLWHAMFGQMGIDLDRPPPKGGYLHTLIGKSMPCSGENEDQRQAVCNYLNQDWVSPFAITALGRPVHPPNQNLTA